LAHSPALQIIPDGQFESVEQPMGGSWLLADAVLGVFVGVADAPAGAQKLPLALMLQTAPAPQSAFEWQPGQQPIVVHISPGAQSALVVHGG
jgi:hypothetical protein